MASNDTTAERDAGADASEDVAARSHLGRYRIDGVLGAGGMGVVLAAHDPELDRAIALKVLRRADPQAQAHLLKEAQAMARLRHANVVAVHDVGIVDGQAFVAMELVTGPTLQAWLQAAPRPWRTIVARFVAAGRGLAAAHAAGIVHRDFKASNVLIDDHDVVRVADFGLAGAAVGGAGTPAYMAPEQHGAEPVGPAADQFAFAVALWEAATGARPFAGPGLEELHAQKLAGKLSTRTGPGPSWLYARLRRALAPAPADRFPSLAALVTALDAGLQRRRRALIGAIAVVALAGTAAGAIALTTGRPAGPRCGLAADDVTRVWNPTTRAQLLVAFAGSARPYARDTAVLVAAALDRQAATLAAARVDACDATHHHGAQSAEILDRRMACFDRRTRELAALVALLSDVPDDATVRRASQAVSQLGTRDDCSGDRSAPRAPAAIQPQVAALEARRAEVRAQVELGRYAAAATSYDALIVDVRALGYAPLIAAVEFERAKAHADAGNKDVAGPAYDAAATAAATAGDDALIAETMLGKLALQAGAGGEAADALAKLSYADVAVTRAGDARLAVLARYQRGTMALQLGKYADAQVDLEAALQMIGPDPTLLSIKIKESLMSVVQGLGDTEAAIALAREVVAAYTAQLGPRHPSTATATDSLGNLLDKTGENEEARPTLLRALAIQEAGDGETTAMAFTLHHIGVNAYNLGRWDESHAALTRSLAIRERLLGPDHALVGNTLASLATLLTDTDRPDEAVGPAERALAILLRTNGPDSPQVAAAYDGIANLRITQGRYADGLAAAQRSFDIRERAFGPKDYRVGRSLARMSFAYEGLHRMDLACPARAKAVSIIQADRGPDSPDLLGSLIGHAACEVTAGHLAAARAAAEQIIRIVADSDDAPAFAGPAHFVLAQVYWADPATRDQARTEAALARAAYATAPGAAKENLAELEAWEQTHR